MSWNDRPGEIRLSHGWTLQRAAIAVLVYAHAPHAAGFGDGSCAVTELSKLTASDALSADAFGESVSIDDARIVVGAFGDDERNLDSGSAYVFRSVDGGYVEQVKLTASDAATGDLFGYAVAISGDMIAVGAPLDSDGAAGGGSVYIFRFDGQRWIEEAELTASDVASGDHFGVPIAADGDVVIVGAANQDGAGQDAGAAYIFRYDGAAWCEEAKLTASDAEDGDHYGYAVAVNGDTAMVGSFNDEHTGPFSFDGAGSAYVYRFDGASWVEETKLTASDGAVGDGFGWSVSLDAGAALIGALGDDDAGPDSGSAYVFRFDPVSADWIEEIKLVAADAAEGDVFGFSVDMRGDVSIVGARFESDGGAEAGAAYVYVFDRGVWTERARLTASDAEAFDHFGFSVSIDSGTAVVSAPESDDAGAGSGSAYVFRGLADCNATGALDVCDIATGGSTDANGNGIPDECEPVAGDLDGDGDVDLADAAGFVECVTGPGGGAPAPCDQVDFDTDGDVDFADFAFFQLAFTGS